MQLRRTPADPDFGRAGSKSGPPGPVKGQTAAGAGDCTEQADHGEQRLRAHASVVTQERYLRLQVSTFSLGKIHGQYSVEYRLYRDCTDCIESVLTVP